MADWIVWEKGLTSKAEILLIADTLRVSRREAAALCMEVWEWWDSNSGDGFIPRLTAHHLSLVIGTPGVGEAFLAAGWLLEDKAGLHMPNWERWMGSSAKKRLQDCKSKRRRRYQEPRAPSE